MANHPLNLALRFLLEIAALVAVGYWAWSQGDGWSRGVSTVGLPLILALLWGVFRVDGDPKEAPIKVRGAARFVLELAILYGGALALFLADRNGLALALALLITFHYGISYHRIGWLLKQ